MDTINLQVHIDSDEMLETLAKIRDKTQELEWLVRLLHAKSGRLKDEENISSLPTAHKDDSDK